jgi:predicted nucleotide-binding protein
MQSKEEIIKQLNLYVRIIDRNNHTMGLANSGLGERYSFSDDMFQGFVGEVSQVLEVVFGKEEKDELLILSKVDGDKTHKVASGNIRGFLLKLIFKLQQGNSPEITTKQMGETMSQVDIKQLQEFSRKIQNERSMGDSGFGVYVSEVSLYLEGVLGEDEKKKFLNLIEKNDIWHEKTLAKMKMYWKLLLSDLEAQEKKQPPQSYRAPVQQSVLQNTISEKPMKPVSKVQESKKVFVVHGHDDLAKKEVEVLLLKLGLEPVILHDQPNNGKTIIEKFEVNAEQCAYAVVLLTPDDIATSRKDMKSHQFRARQNVIYELGFFSGKLGRNKVCALSKNDPTGNIELPSDFLGVVYVSMDGNGSWRIQLAKEMRSAGLNINLESLL